MLSKPQPVLTQMPWNVKKLIVDSANSSIKMSLRQSSKDFKELVDRANFRYKKVGIDLVYNKIIISVMLTGVHSLFCFHFQRQANGYLRSEENNEYRLVPQGDFITAAVNQLRKIVENRRISIDTFTIDVSVIYFSLPSLLSCLSDAFASLDHKLKARTFEVLSFSQESVIPAILPHLEPGTLESLEFKVADRVTPTHHRHLNLNNVISLEQFNRAKRLNLQFSTNLSPENVKHLQYFSVLVERLTLDYVKTIIENALQNSELDEIYIYYDTAEYLNIYDYIIQLSDKIYSGEIIPPGSPQDDFWFKFKTNPSKHFYISLSRYHLYRLN